MVKTKQLFTKFVALVMLSLALFLTFACVKPEELNPELSFASYEIQVKLGETYTLTPNVKDVKDYVVDYDVADTTVLKVENGVVTPLKIGSTKVTATVAGTDLSKELTVNVVTPITQVNISGGTSVTKGTSIQLTASVVPASASQAVTWKSSNTSIATVDATGKVTGVSEGDVTITATSSLDKQSKKEHAVKVTSPLVTSIVVTGNSTIDVGAKTILKAEVNPADASKELDWVSLNPEIVTIDPATGIITGVAAGTGTIKVSSKDGSNISYEFVVTVNQIYASKIEVTGEKVVFVGEDIQLTSKVTPSAVSQEVSWRSSNENVATVDATGKVTGVSVGTCNIIVSSVNTADGKPLEVEYSVTVKTDVPAESVLVVSASFTGENGAEITYNGEKFVLGTTAYKTIKDAALIGGTIVVLPGVYEDDVEISAPTKLIGPNAGVNPNTRIRAEEAVIKGAIIVNPGVDGVVVDGFEFTGDGCFDASKLYGAAEKYIKNISFINNYAHDCGGDAANPWGTGRVLHLAVVRFWNNEGSNPGIFNVNIENNLFVGNDKINLLLARMENVVVKGNSFRNFGTDAIRTDGGYNTGTWDFIDNKFVNDTLSAKNAIFFRSYSGVGQTINIKHNTFKNIGEAETQYSGAISSNTYQECDTFVYIESNTFDNCANYIMMRNNGVGTKSWVCDIKFNVFKGVPDGYYYRNFNFTTDTDATNPSLAVLEHNLYLDNDGEVITDFTEYASLFKQVKSNTNNFETEEAYYDAINGNALVSTLYVNSDWASKNENDSITYLGQTLVFGVSAFATIQDAIEKAEAGDSIYVAPGTYADAVTIDKNGITLKGANYFVNPNTDLRSSESKITGSITLGSVENVVINGFLFSAGATALGFIIAPEYSDLNNITISYCLFDKDVVLSQSAFGLLHFEPKEADVVYRNIKVLYNRVEDTAKRTMFIYGTNFENLQVSYNYYNNTSNANFTDTIKISAVLTGGWGVRGVTEFTENTFENSPQYTIWLQRYSYGTINVYGNTFINNGMYDAAYNRAPVTAINYIPVDGMSVTFNIKYNYIDGPFGVRLQNAAAQEGNWFANVNYNIFKSTQAALVVSNNASKENFNVINAEYNYFEKAVTDASFAGVSSYANAYEQEASVPKYVSSDTAIFPTKLEITNKVETLIQEEKHQLNITISPANTTQKRVLYTSSDPSIASVSSTGEIRAIKPGKVTIEVVSVADEEVLDEFELEVLYKERLEVTYTGNAVLKVGETLDVNAVLLGSENPTLTWTSGNTGIATIADGTITAVSKGYTEITIKTSDNKYEYKMGVTVIEENQFSQVMMLLIQANAGIIINQNVMYIGSDDGSADYLHNVYGASNYYYATDLPEVTQNMLPSGRPNHSGKTMTSIEFICVHDTAGSGASSTAQANSNWCTNTGNTATSWHYTIGNDGLFQQLDDTTVGFHAGDGTTVTFEWTKTNVQAIELDEDSIDFYFDEDGNVVINAWKPEVTIIDGYIALNGVKTNVGVPVREGVTYDNDSFTANFVPWTVGEDGYYYLGTMHGAAINVDGEYLIAQRGGNLNSIGIETAVNAGSDVYKTWQITAKFVASLLVEYDLGLDRVKFHNDFSGKVCPRTMLTAGLDDEFIKMVEMEYLILKYFSDYTIEFISDNTNILDNTGRVVSVPEYTTLVTYTIKITDKDGNVEEVKLSSLVLGKYNHYM